MSHSDWSHIRSLPTSRAPFEVTLRRRRVAIVLAAVLMSACLGALAALWARWSEPAPGGAANGEKRMSLEALKDELGAGMQASLRDDFPDRAGK